tara:strand:- start:670 stop:795 length:126 start_codon:yes stop_codon:yes gene_type:complete
MKNYLTLFSLHFQYNRQRRRLANDILLQKQRLIHQIRHYHH